MDANISGESNLQILLQSASPQHNPGKYVFCTVAACTSIADRCCGDYAGKRGYYAGFTAGSC